MNHFDIILKDLKSHFGVKILLSPDDISPLINKSRDAQQALRKRNSFPIPYTKLGMRITINIYDLAQYLSTNSSHSVQPEPNANSIPYLKPRKSRFSGFAKQLLE